LQIFKDFKNNKGVLKPVFSTPVTFACNAILEHGVGVEIVLWQTAFSSAGFYGLNAAMGLIVCSGGGIYSLDLR
jgi:hypothetical protein